MSLRSFDSTNSSMLTTPDNIGTNIKKRLAFSGVSPDVVRGAGVNPDKSIADITDNWRSSRQRERYQGRIWIPR